MDIHNRNTSSGMPVPGIGFILGFGAFVVLGGLFITWITSTGILPVLPPQASEQARNTDGLFYVLLTIGGMVFLLVQGMLVYSVIRFRARPNDTSDGPNFHGNALLEIVWTIIPTVVVFVLAVLAVIVWNTNSMIAENENRINGERVAMSATGQRYAWSFEYLTNETNIKGERIVINAADFHTYVGQNVKLDLKPVDVIHSFWVPAMRIKQDVLPGRLTSIRFTPANTGQYEYSWVRGPQVLVTEPGAVVAPPTEGAAEAAPEQLVMAIEDGAQVEAFINGYNDDKTWVNVSIGSKTGWLPSTALTTFFNKYRIVCAELCGGGHGQMFAWMYVHDGEDAFMAWYNQQVQQRFEPPKDPVLLGQQVLSSGKYPCANCHVLDSFGWQGITGPSLNGIGDRAGGRRPGLNAVEYLMQSIHLPNEYLVPGYAAGQMPHFGYDPVAPDGQVPYNQMSESDLIGIVAYLCSQTNSGSPQDTSCDLTFGDDGQLADVDSANIYLKVYADFYDSLYEADE